MKLIVAILLLFCLPPSIVRAECHKRHCKKCKKEKVQHNVTHARYVWRPSVLKIKRFKTRSQAVGAIQSKGWVPHVIWDGSDSLPRPD